MTRRTWRLLLIGYGLKTALLAAVWLAAPELLSRASDGARHAWAWLTTP